MTYHMRQLTHHCFSQLNISPAQLDFLRMCVSKETTPEALAAYYGTIDFERLGSQHVCALAELSRRLEYQGVPRALIPRVRGIIRYHTALNTKQFQEFYRLLKLFNAHGINVMLMKGGAMRAHYMPRVIRYMSDIDFWVSLKDFDRACELVQASGEYEYFPYSHHVGLRRNGCMLEMHVSYLKENEGQDNEEQFWQEAEIISLLDQPVYIPSPEALLLSILTNIFGDCIQGNVYGTSWVRWAVDCRWLIEQQEIDWNRITTLCEEYRINLAAKTMLQILNSIFPALVAPCVQDNIPAGAEETQKIVWMFRMNKSFFAAQTSRESGKKIAFAWHSFRRHWCRHRLMSRGNCWLADLIHFPGYIKGLWRCTTWRQFATYLWHKIRNPKQAVSAP